MEVDTGNFPTNMHVARSKRTGLTTFSPDAMLTGTVQLLVEAIDDNVHQPDTHKFALTVLPRSATPTMTIVPLRGSIVDVTSNVNASRHHCNRHVCVQQPV